VSAQVLGQPRRVPQTFSPLLFRSSRHDVCLNRAQPRFSIYLRAFVSMKSCYGRWRAQAIVFNGGVSVTKPLIALCLGVTTVLFAQDKSTLSPPEATQRRPGEFENQFLAIQIVHGWTVATSTGQTWTLVKGKYLLSINPIFLHASGVIGGRFGEIASGKKSIDAVMHNVDQPAGGFECSEWPPE